MASAFVPVFMFAVRFGKISETLRYLGVFLIFNVCVEIIAGFLGYKGINNIYLLHLHTPIEFYCVLFVTASVIGTNIISKILIFLAVIFTLFCLIDAMWIETLQNFNFFPRGLEGLIIISTCSFFFYRLFVAEETVDLLKYPYFWLFGGWLIYFSGTFFLFIYKQNAGFTLTFPVIHSILNIFLNLVYTYTLWLDSRKLISQ